MKIINLEKTCSLVVSHFFISFSGDNYEVIHRFIMPDVNMFINPALKYVEYSVDNFVELSYISKPAFVDILNFDEIVGFEYSNPTMKMQNNIFRNHIIKSVYYNNFYYHIFVEYAQISS
jgi:hypothetical protein